MDISETSPPISEGNVKKKKKLSNSTLNITEISSTFSIWTYVCIYSTNQP